MPKTPIVIIDGDCKNTELLMYRLSREGYLVDAYFGIPTNLGLLLTFRIPAAIIMEVHYDFGSGFDFLGELRTEPLFKDTKVVVLSNPRGSGDEAKARAIGVDGYMTKPYSPRELIERLKELLSTPATS